MVIRKFKDRKKARPKPNDHLKEVVENGLQFIERGIQGLWDEDDKHHLKYSVINFYSGIELILKARLMMEHWALIVSNSGKANVADFLIGDFVSVNLQESLKRLRNIAALTISDEAEDVFDNLRQHRNKMVHFFHSATLSTNAGKKLKEEIILEQCKGWFLLRRLIGDSWEVEFENYKSRIAQINGSMKKHKHYLTTVYEKIKPELDSAKDKGATLGRCWSCDYNAHVLNEHGPTESSCHVCTARHAFLLVPCGQNCCSEEFLLDAGHEKTDCPKCGESWDCAHAQEIYSDKEKLILKGSLDDEFGNCQECGGHHTVGTIDDRSFCYFCFTFAEPMEECQFCYQKGTGITDDSHFSGCDECDGLQGSLTDD